MRCSACKMVYYCSAECSKSHWQSEHRSICKAFSARRQEYDKDEQISRKFIEAQRLAEGNDCAICLSKMTADETLTLDCSHVFCMVCISDIDKADFESGKSHYKCPLCRTERNEIFVSYQHKYAVSWVQRANRLMTDNPLRSMWLNVARREIAKLDFLEDCENAWYIFLGVKADIELAQGFYDEAIRLCEAALAAQPSPKSQDKAFFIAQNLTLAESLLKVDPPRLQESKSALRSVFAVVDQFDAKNTRKAMALQCELELIQGNPKECISIGLMVIEMNRWYDNAYIHVARALVSLGDCDKAVLVMRKAAAYETAWDSKRAELVKAKLDEFLAIQEQQQQQQKANIHFDLSSI